MQRTAVSLVGMVVFTVACAYADEPLSFQSVKCAGSYPHHLQGICTNGSNAIYWSFTTVLVKTDNDGKVLKKIPVGDHHGDLCFHDGRVYVAVNFGNFNDPKGNADSRVFVYDADDLADVARHRVPEVIYGAGGITFHGGHLFVVGGLPAGIEENYVYEYDKNFEFVKKHVVGSGHTHLGIQTAAFADGHFWFGCYGEPKVLLKTNATFETVDRYEFDCSLGIETLGSGRFLVARGSCSEETGCVGEVVTAASDPDKGLAVD